MSKPPTNDQLTALWALVQAQRNAADVLAKALADLDAAQTVLSDKRKAYNDALSVFNTAQAACLSFNVGK